MSTNPIITRFPPSPTGYLHIGRARTALFNYLFTKKNGGKMIFRFEDTDKERSKIEFEEIMKDSLKWLGIVWDNAVIEKQTGRTEIYKRYLKKLVDDDKAYISKETIFEGEKLGQVNEVVRFRNPNKKVTFKDLIRGDITIDTTDLKDFIIARNINDPLYHLAVVVDDFEMGITHIIRGDDGISNTPRQILIQEGIGAPKPIYAHLPLILAPDKSKLSGRHGAVSVTEYRNNGYLPEALVNYLALLGWNPGNDKEIFAMAELIAEFDISKIHKSGAVFDLEKLKWFNKQYVNKLSNDDFSTQAETYMPEWLKTNKPAYEKLLPIIKEKISYFGEVPSLFNEGGELRFVNDQGKFTADQLLWKKNPSREVAAKHLGECRRLVADMDAKAFKSDNYQLPITNNPAIKAAIWPYAEANGKGDVLWPLRMSLTGQDKSPDPFTCLFILGKDESLRRIEMAISILKTQ